MSAGVMSARALRGEAIAQVLEHAAIHVLRGEASAAADVLVLVDADSAVWSRARAAGRPAIAVVAEVPTGEELLEFVESGAVGVLSRASTEPELVGTVARVAAGESGLTRRQSKQLVDALRIRKDRHSTPPPAVTRRESQILVAIEAGLSVKETARRLEISPRTVENTQRLLFRKLGVRTRSQAVARALDTGLLGSSPNRRFE